MKPTQTDAQRQRRSRLVLTIFLIVIVTISVIAALLIRSGLEDEDLQRQLQELREEGRPDNQ